MLSLKKKKKKRFESQIHFCL